MRVYLVPGAPPEIREALQRALAAAGHELVNDPAAAPPPAGLQQAERQAFLLAVDRMLEADALLADVSQDEGSAGWCAAWMLAKGRLAVLACRRDRRGALTPMLAGNPSPWQRLVLYDAPEDLERGVRETLGGGR